MSAIRLRQRKPRRWIEHFTLRCADRDAQIVSEHFCFDVYRRFVLGRLTAEELTEIIGYTRGIWLRGQVPAEVLAELWQSPLC